MDHPLTWSYHLLVEQIGHGLDLQVDDDDKYEYYISIRNQTLQLLYHTHSYFVSQ